MSAGAERRRRARPVEADLRILVINSGSSSVKFELFRMEPQRSVAGGEVERIGESVSYLRYRTSREAEWAIETADIPDHRAALEIVLQTLDEAMSGPGEAGFSGIGHRVVHGGERFSEPVLIDDATLDGIREMTLLAPLHAGANVAGIEAGLACCPETPQVAVFDTAFHRRMPAYAREYGLPRELARAHGLRRYGFHGTSHAYVARRAARLLGRRLEDLRLITLHLGNGASMAAIRGGVSVDTSMGMTPLEGLIMGSRCGDIDPAVPMLLGQLTGRSREDVHRLLNFESGLKGLTGERDMRAVHALADGGDPDAVLAIEMYCYRVKKYIGAYMAALGGADALVFTAGVGENDADVRSRVCEGLEPFGIAIDRRANEAEGVTGERVVSARESRVGVLVIPTDEGSEIARQTLECITAERPEVLRATEGSRSR